jgi:hypothetical protein
MQPPRRKISDPNVGRVDRLADWLLTYCPLSTLALLTALVSGSPGGIPQAWPIFAGMAAGDLGINLVRWLRRAKRGAGERKHGLHQSAPA